MPATYTTRLNGLTTSVAIKAPCRVATTAAITLSGTQTVDGVAVVENDRVLVKNQASAIGNGIYTVETGDWTRAPDFDGTLDVVTGTLVFVHSGSDSGGTFWRVTSTGSLIPGEDAIVFSSSPVISEIVIQPETFEATGAAGDNQNDAMEAMMVVARAAGKAIVWLTEDSTYTVTNPFMVGGCRELLVEGNGANWMNFRTGDPVALGVFDANFAPFRSPNGFLPNGVDVLTYGAGQGPGANDYGVTISTAAAGSLTVTSATSIPVGPALIYGWDRFGFDGMPPTAIYFEWVEVVTAGTTATLRSPLTYGYDASAPEKTTADRAGVPRLLSLVRSAGAFRAYREMDNLTVRNLKFVVNTGQNASGNEAYNGLPGFGGAKRILLENVEAPRLFVQASEYVELIGVKCPGDLEIDKMLGTVVIGDGCEIGNLVGGIGALNVYIHPGAKIFGTNALAPMERYEIDGATVQGVDAFGSGAMLGFHLYGSAVTRIKNPLFIASDATADRIFPPNGKVTLTPTITSATILTATRAAYNASEWFKAIRIGSTIYAGSVPVAEVTAMPRVPTPPLTTGDVAIGYKLLGGSIAAATPLSLLLNPDIRMEGERIEGTYARQISAPFGSDVQAVGIKPGNIRTDQVREDGFWFDQTLSEYARASNIYEFTLGRGFQITNYDMTVTRMAVDAGAVTGILEGITVAGATVTLISSVDLKTGELGTGDFPTVGIVAVRFTDGSRALTEGNRAGWLAMFEGRWL